ncbi:MAG TPA: hypothetical protein VMU80_25990, partial [Bryobacteraceae bacterium]|nr:hypothetical protein [Bryobacteraceae bacterium]
MPNHGHNTAGQIQRLLFLPVVCFVSSALGQPIAGPPPNIEIVRVNSAVQPAQLQIIGSGLAPNGFRCRSFTLGGVGLTLLSRTNTLLTLQIPGSIGGHPGTYLLVSDDCSDLLLGVLQVPVTIGSQGPSGA